MSTDMYFDSHWEGTSTSVAIACRNGDCDNLKVLLTKNKSVDGMDNRGWRPIHEAAANNHLDCINILLDEGNSDLNWQSYEGETPMMIALLLGYGTVAELLLSAGSDPNRGNNESVSPLHTAVTMGLVKTAENLLHAGAKVGHKDFGGETPLHVAVSNKSIDMVKLLLSHDAKIDDVDDHGRSALFMAAQCGNIKILKIIIDQTKSADSVIDKATSDGTTPLIIAAQCGSLDCIRLLIENGANINRISNDGYTALYLAVNGGHFECVKVLEPLTDMSIKKRKCKDCFQCLLHLALRNEKCRFDILKFLLDSGLDVKETVLLSANEYDPLFLLYLRGLRRMYDYHSDYNFKCTLLYCAIKTYDVKCVEEIIKRGANVNSTSEDFLHPLLPAVFLNRLEIVKILLKHGSNPNHIFERNGKSYPIFLELCSTTHINVGLIQVLKAGADFRLSKNIDLEIVNSNHTKCLNVMRKVFMGIPLLKEDIVVIGECEETNILNSNEINCGKTMAGFKSLSLQHFCRVKLLQTVLEANNWAPVNRYLNQLPLPNHLINYLLYKTM